MLRSPSYSPELWLPDLITRVLMEPHLQGEVTSIIYTREWTSRAGDKGTFSAPSLYLARYWAGTLPSRAPQGQDWRPHFTAAEKPPGTQGGSGLEEPAALAAKPAGALAGTL